KARAAVLKALALEPTLADAHASLGDQLCVYDWDAPAAERELRRAIELNPSVANAHYFYANCLAAHGRLDEALAEAMRAHELDPLNPDVATGLPWALYVARRYDEAIVVQQKSLDLEPGSAHAQDWKSTRLNSSHVAISYAVFCLKKKIQDRPALDPL